MPEGGLNADHASLGRDATFAALSLNTHRFRPWLNRNAPLSRYLCREAVPPPANLKMHSTMKPEYNRIPWEDVRDAASKMFHVWWLGDGEIKWVEECWQHLGEANLTDNSPALERTATFLRLLTLARIYEEFCGLAWDEDPETPVTDLVEDLEIDPLSLGILATKADPDAFDDVADKYIHQAVLLAATDAQRKEIFDCLSKGFGDEFKLYSRMSKTNRSGNETDNGSEDDLSEDDLSEFDITESNSVALSYVVNGFRRE